MSNSNVVNTSVLVSDALRQPVLVLCATKSRLFLSQGLQGRQLLACSPFALDALDAACLTDMRQVSYQHSSPTWASL